MRVQIELRGIRSKQENRLYIIEKKTHENLPLCNTPSIEDAILSDISYKHKTLPVEKFICAAYV